MRYSISPQKNIIGDVGGLIARILRGAGGFLLSSRRQQEGKYRYHGAFQQRCREQVDPSGTITLEVQIDGAAAADQDDQRGPRGAVRENQESRGPYQLNGYPAADGGDDPREEKLQLKGGLGLIRLALENKSRISVDYKEPLLIVESEIPLGGHL